MQPGLNSCPARPGGYPGSPADAGLPAGLPLSCPSAVWAQAPTHSVELPLGVWPGAGHWREACPALGKPYPQVETAIAVERDKPVCQGLQWEPQAGGPSLPGEQKISPEEPAPGSAAPVQL